MTWRHGGQQSRGPGHRGTGAQPVRRAGRRAAVAALTTLALVITACASAEPKGSGPQNGSLAQTPGVAAARPGLAPDASPTAAAPPSPTAGAPPQSAPAEPQPTLRAAEPFTPHPDDVYPNAKQLAARVAQALTTYEVGATPATVAAAVAPEFGGDPDDLAAAASELVRGGVASAGDIVYPQLGGLTPDAASVMVVTRQRLVDAEGRQTTVTRTLDVRLRLAGDRWAFDRLASDGGPVASRPGELSDAAEAVLDHPRIELPDSARWDIYRGDIDLRLLELMLEIAERYTIGVVTLSSGHSYEVFGTDRQSDHTKGRAVDIYSLDGDLVVSQRRERTPAHRLSRWIFDLEGPKLGSPWAFDGYGGRSFTDAVHQDHLHVAVPPAPPVGLPTDSRA